MEKITSWLTPSPARSKQHLSPVVAPNQSTNPPQEVTPSKTRQPAKKRRGRKTSAAIPSHSSSSSQPPLSFYSDKKESSAQDTMKSQPAAAPTPDANCPFPTASGDHAADPATPVHSLKRRRKKITGKKKKDHSLLLPVFPVDKKQSTLTSTPQPAGEPADLKVSIAPSLSKPSLDEATGNGSAVESHTQKKKQEAQAL